MKLQRNRTPTFKTNVIFHLWALWLIVLLSPSTSAESTLILDTQHEIGLLPYLLVYQDSSRNMTIDDVSHANFPGTYRPIAGSSLTLQNSDTNYWVKITMRNLGPARKWVLHIPQQPGLEHVVFFESNPDGSFRRVATGDTEPFSNRDILSLTFAFSLSFTRNEQKDIFLLFDNTQVKRIVPLSVLSVERFQSFDRFSWMAVAAYYGILLTLFIYNFLLHIKLKEKSHLYYLLYIAFFAAGMSSVDGTASWLFGSASTYEYLYVMLQLFFQVLFVTTLIDLRKHSNRDRGLFYAVSALVLTTAVFDLLVERNQLSTLLFYASSISTWLFVLWIIIKAMKQKTPGASYLLLAELCVIIGYVVAILAYFGLCTGNDFIAYLPAKTGSVLQLMIFSLVLGDRVTTALLASYENEKKAIAAESARQVAENLSREDPLTKLNNRRAFFEFGERAFIEAKRHSLPYAVMMVDIDHFKRVNDTYGHSVGDKAICHVANICQSVARESDITGRLGGEEFALLLPFTDLPGAQILAERLRSNFESSSLHVDDLQLNLTASIGVAESSAAHESLVELVDLADQALYKAKSSGRNRVVTWQAEQ